MISRVVHGGQSPLTLTLSPRRRAGEGTRNSHHKLTSAPSLFRSSLRVIRVAMIRPAKFIIHPAMTSRITATKRKRRNHRGHGWHRFHGSERDQEFLASSSVPSVKSEQSVFSFVLPRIVSSFRSEMRAGRQEVEDEQYECGQVCPSPLNHPAKRSWTPADSWFSTSQFST